MKQSSLTIAIPTYNRVGKLKKQIIRLLQQMGENDVLLISDNATPESLSDVLKPFIDDPRIVLHKNENNIGLTANIVKCFERVNTEWMWLLSDDDDVLPNALDTIRWYITSGVADFVTFTTDLGSSNGADIFCDSFSTYLSSINCNFGNHLLISNNLYRMNMIRPYMKFLYWGCYVNAPHIAPVFYALENNVNARLILSGKSVVKWNKPDIHDTWNASGVYNILFLPDVLTSSMLRSKAIKALLRGLPKPEALIAQLAFNRINDPSSSDKIDSYANTIMNIYINYGGLNLSIRAFLLKKMIKFPRLYLKILGGIFKIIRNRPISDVLQNKGFKFYL